MSTKAVDIPSSRAKANPVRTNAEYDYLFKMLLVGDSGVGKSTLLHRLIDDDYSGSFVSTIGVDLMIKSLQVDNKSVKLQIWDTAGQERFRTITRSFYRGAQGCLLIYDVTDRESFDNVHQWLDDIRTYTRPDTIVLLVASKCDQQSRRVVSQGEGEDLARSCGLRFIETSAKSAHNVEKAFAMLAAELKARAPTVPEKPKGLRLSRRAVAETACCSSF